MSHLHGKHCCLGGHSGHHAHTSEAPSVLNYSQCKQSAADQPVEEAVNNLLDFSTYGDISRANQYFECRLHSAKWRKKDMRYREKTILAATRIVDCLDFAGVKTDSTQTLEFPRNGQTIVPGDIEQAVYEIAFQLLLGRRPEVELESLAITSVGMSSVRTTYKSDRSFLEHTLNGVPSALAWSLLKPYLNHQRDITLKKV